MNPWNLHLSKKRELLPRQVPGQSSIMGYWACVVGKLPCEPEIMQPISLPEPAATMANEILTQPDTESQPPTLAGGGDELLNGMAKGFEEPPVWVGLWESISGHLLLPASCLRWCSPQLPFRCPTGWPSSPIPRGHRHFNLRQFVDPDRRPLLCRKKDRRYGRMNPS